MKRRRKFVFVEVFHEILLMCYEIEKNEITAMRPLKKNQTCTKRIPQEWICHSLTPW